MPDMPVPPPSAEQPVDAEYLVDGKYSIEDMVDMDALRNIFDKFSKATGFTTGFLSYPSQKILIRTGWRDFCVKFHRENPASAVCCKESNVALSANLRTTKELSIQHCALGLVDGATPIFVRGKYVAYLATGQIFLSKPDPEVYRQIAKRFNYDEEAYLEAMSKVPVVNEETFRNMLSFLSEIAVLVAEMGLHNLEIRERSQELENEIAYRKKMEVENARLEEQQRQLEAKVLQTQKLESLGILASGIAHDFNNLLMAIMGNADLALKDLSDVSPARPMIQEIENVTRRAADLCKQMLAYSGKAKLHPQSLNLSELVQEMVHMLEVSISKKVILRYNMAENLPTILADPTQLRQITMNLIINGSDAIGNKSGVVSITTGCMECDRSYLNTSQFDEDLEPGQYVFLEVSDNGCGMSEETRNRIFDPFFTTKLTGRGLGLAAVIGIVRKHKGSIKVYSEPGKGTTFKVFFPAQGTAAPQEIVESKPSDTWHGEGTVLMVDDEETVRFLGKRMLEHLGFKVLIAANGREAITVFTESTQPIRCVLLDMTMPQMGGEETFRELRRLDPNVKVVLTSGYSKKDISERFIGRGIAGFMQKPYRLVELVQTLRGIFGN